MNPRFPSFSRPEPVWLSKGHHHWGVFSVSFFVLMDSVHLRSTLVSVLWPCLVRSFWGLGSIPTSSAPGLHRFGGPGVGARVE